MNLCNQKSTECKYEDWRKRVAANMATDQIVTQVCGKREFESEQSVSDVSEENESIWAKIRKSSVII
jgi:hypothetical protein